MFCLCLCKFTVPKYTSSNQLCRGQRSVPCYIYRTCRQLLQSEASKEGESLGKNWLKEYLENNFKGLVRLWPYLVWTQRIWSCFSLIKNIQLCFCNNQYNVFCSYNGVSQKVIHSSTKIQNFHLNHSNGQICKKTSRESVIDASQSQLSRYRRRWRRHLNNDG